MRINKIITYSVNKMDLIRTDSVNEIGLNNNVFS